MRKLAVYYQERVIAELIQNGHGFLELEYRPGWQREGFDISVSLPRKSLHHTGDEVRAFFENMLPEGMIRDTLAQRYGTDKNNVFRLLQHVGQDCAGAFSIGGPGSRGGYKELKQEDIIRLLDSLPKYPMASGEGRTSLSLAGAQHKVPLFCKDGVYYLPQDGAASNCIVKLPIAGYSHTVENEYFCLELGQSIGLPVVSSSILALPEYCVLVVNRYDRKGNDFYPERLPQEDFCQMSALSSSIKYERDGGPSLADCAGHIRRYSQQPAADLLLLVRWTVFNCCIGNNDAHAKNISMLRQGRGLHLAPFYDLLSTTYYGNRLIRRQAMYVGGKSKSFYVSRRRWERFAQDVGLPFRSVYSQVELVAQSILSSLDSVVAHVLQNGVQEETANHLAHHIRTRSANILRALEV